MSCVLEGNSPEGTNMVNTTDAAKGGPKPLVKPSLVLDGCEAQLLSACDVAAILRCSTHTVHRFKNSGRMPQPLRFMRNPLPAKSAADMHSWLEAGCPECHRPAGEAHPAGDDPSLPWKTRRDIENG